ncbi:hypothetical protein NLU14_08580 [Marinobacter sp. 71-i]|uniref:Uncharacterized protein n=1 Tax=Marinobacter iranensis TaxID=2962607 RepID=A0ABT5Y9C4_9GAMM|nr:hypothetical protein [Marinobacter iranensis]MDF0750284.1 hypothetical protein [Marinobacter iranensis]
MADLNKEVLQADVVHAGEYGNQARATRSYTGALASGDVLHLIRLPADTELHDLDLFHGVGGAAAVVDVGYVPVNSDNGAGDPDYFLAAADIAAAGRKRANTALKPVRLPYAVDIVITAGAAVASNEITASVQYEWRGR